MYGSSFGKVLKLTTWGESHGPALGAVLDGFPAGFSLRAEDIQDYMDRRRPGRSPVSTARSEADKVEILSGVFEGVTTGTPISLLIRNTSQHSGDYDNLRNCYRPGHADYTYDRKYGIRDHRGGGRSSGRETAARVAAGAIGALFLKELGVDICAYTKSIGPVQIREDAFSRDLIRSTATCMPDEEADRAAQEYLNRCRQEQDSAGGVIECIMSGVPAGIGDPVLDKLDARLAQAIMSIGAVKAVEIGDGTQVSVRKGSENNDAFTCESGQITKKTNHAGGILGGISDGSPIVLRAYVKPTPSVFRPQETVDRDGNPQEIVITGRHDPVIVPRAVVVTECMCAAVLLDAMLAHMTSRAQNVISFYRRDS